MLMEMSVSVQVFGYVEDKLVAGMAVFSHPGYRGVTETWNVMQHEVGSTGQLYT